MKFNCGLSGTDWFEKRTNWHRWFAWLPVSIKSRDCRWLEYVERKGTYTNYIGYGSWQWEYRA